MRIALFAVTICLILGIGTTAQAALDLLFDFNPNNTSGAVGSSHYSLTESGYTMTVSGYNANNTSHDLYWKFTGSDEHGIGFTNPDTGAGGDHELSLTTSGTVANYMEIDVSQEYHVFTSANIRVQSIDAGSQGIPESADIYGSNSIGSIGTVIETLPVADSNLLVPLADWGTYAYYSVATHPQAAANLNDVLFDSIEVLPEPATLTLLALGGGLALLRRRRRGTSPPRRQMHPREGL